MIDVSTQTDSDATPTDISGGSSLLEAMTGTEAPSIHTFLQLLKPIITSTVQEVSISTQNTEHQKILQELADIKAQISGKDEDLEHYKRLVGEMTGPRDEQPHQYSEAQTQTDDAYINIAEVRASESRLKEQADSSQDEVTRLRAALGEARSRVSELEVEKTHSEEYIQLKDREIEKLKGDAAKMSSQIRVGFEELKDFHGLSAGMYNRLVQAGNILNHALGRDDRLMDSAYSNLKRWEALIEAYFRDVVRTEAEVVSEVQLAVVRRPAGCSVADQAETGPVCDVSEDDHQLQQLVDELFEAAETNGGASKVETEGSAPEAEVEETKAESRKTSETASIFAAAAGIDLSCSSPSSAAKGKQKEERTPALGQEGSKMFSFAPSDDNVEAEQTPRYQGFEGASQSFNFSSANSFDFFASTAQGEEKVEPASVPVFGAEGSTKFSFSPTGFAPTFGGSSGSAVGDSNIASGTISTQTDGKEEQEPDRNDSKATSETPKFSFTGSCDFSASSSQGPQEEEPAPKTAMFGGETSHSFSFTPSSFAPTFGSVGTSPSDGDGEEDKQKRESTNEAPSQPLFPAEAFAKFDSGPSGKTFNFGNFDFSIMGASEGQVEASPSSSNPGTAVAGQDDEEGTSEGQVEASPSSSSPGTAVAGQDDEEGTSEGQVEASPSSSDPGIAIKQENENHDYLYDLEPGYVPPEQRLAVPRLPAQRLPVVDQAGVELTLTTDTNGGEAADGDLTGVPRITITPASAFEDNVTVGSSNVLEQHGFDVAALSRIVGLGSPVAQEDFERRNLEGEDHGTESLLESLLPREGHYSSYAEATGIQDFAWHGRGRTAKEIHSECEKGFGAEDGMEADIALVMSGFENLHLRRSLPSAGSGTRMENARVDEDTQAAQAQPDIALVSQPNESSSATTIDGAMQPPMRSQVESTAPSSSSSSSTSEAPLSTPPTTHASPEPERRDENGNPMNSNGQFYF